MIYFKQLKKHKEIVHGVMEKKDGPASPFFLENRKNVLAALKKAEFRKAGLKNLFFPEQIHGKKIFLCRTGETAGIKKRVDGLISGVQGQILVVRTADCLPILFYDPKKKIVGAIHAGRKGAEKGIIEETMKVFAKHGSNAKDLIVGLGPHIRKCCYYLRETGEPYDLTKKVLEKLLKSAVKRKNIEDCGICSYCDKKQRFFSARRRETENKKNKGSANPACFGSFIGLKQ